MAAERAQRPALFLRFASGEVYEVDAMDSDTEGVPHGYAVPVPFIRSGRIFAMLESYARTHATHERGCASAVPDIGAWDRRFMEQVRDTDTLHDIFLAASTMRGHGAMDGLMDLCAEATADMVKGGTVEEVKSLLNIADTGLTPEQELEAQRHNERVLCIG